MLPAERQLFAGAVVVKITGADRVLRRLDRMAGAQAHREIGAALFAGGHLIATEAQISITTGAVSGKGHVPSAPGEPPNNDTGALANQIEVTQVGDLKVEISSNAPHAAPLELGTSKMTERPYMRPAAVKRRGEAVQLVRRVIARQVRG